MIDRAAILGLVLAGGQSRRMQGPEKSLLALDGKPLVARACDRLSAQTGEIVLNANGDPQRFSSLGLPVVADTIGGFAGPLAGILAGMQWAIEHRPGTTHLASAASDTPFFPSDLVSRLVGAAPSPDAIVIARSAGNKHPVFGLWPVKLAEPLLTFLQSGENAKIMAFVGQCVHGFAEFDFDGGHLGDPFFNVNTQDDFATAERIARERGNAA